MKRIGLCFRLILTVYMKTSSGNLKLQYTDLTSGDLRFCALLRLNMPTKEISKLLNISTRGVDAARYRLRKKFNLLPEESLTDFLINFK